MLHQAEDAPALLAPKLGTEIYKGEKYVIIGRSARAQLNSPASARHGMVASSELDDWGHFRGDTPSGQGDSGGACFTQEEWREDLVAINVGVDAAGMAVLVPVAAVLGLCSSGASDGVGVSVVTG